MNCREAFQKMLNYLDQDLTEDKVKDLEGHIKLCRHCEDYYDFEKKLRARLKSSCCGDRVPDDVRTRVEKLLDNPPA